AGGKVAPDAGDAIALDQQIGLFHLAEFGVHGEQIRAADQGPAIAGRRAAQKAAAGRRCLGHLWSPRKGQVKLMVATCASTRSWMLSMRLLSRGQSTPIIWPSRLTARPAIHTLSMSGNEAKLTTRSAR